MAKTNQELAQNQANSPTNLESKKVNFADLIKSGATRTEILESFGSLNLAKIVKEAPPTFGKLMRAFGMQASKDYAAVIVADLSKSFNQDLGKEEILEIVDEIHAGIYLNLSLESLYLVCRQIKTSNQYGKLSINKVLSALNDHQQELSNAIANENYNKHLALKFNAERNVEKKDKKQQESRARFAMEKAQGKWSGNAK